MTFFTASDFEHALTSLTQPDGGAIAAARTRQGELTKPAGSLGRLEDIAIFFAGWQARVKPDIARGKVLVFAGNHGVTVHGISAFPAAVTTQMVANFQAGGAAINALAKSAGLDFGVVPIALDRPTEDFTVGPAMSEEECLFALSLGADAVTDDLDLLVLGEMGIGNSTAAAALAQRSFGGSAVDWVGPGTGLDAGGVGRKAAIVERAIAHHADAPTTAFETLRRVGGRETAAIAGAVLRARQLRIPVLLDGFISSASIAPLAAHQPEIVAHCLAGHCSVEPGHARLLEKLGLEPLLKLGMRLGEGSGGAVAANIVRSALAAHAEMATFAEAGVASAG
jgi:nicotinate-nucleotide--dimethylbenzimidazole phosphoribosyltransferase